jgi:protein TonB
MAVLASRPIPFWKSSWGTSLGIHLAFALFVAAVIWPRDRSRGPMDFEVYEAPKLATQAPVQLSKPIEAKQAEPEKRAVFGASRKALTDASDPNAANVKLGNTVAKDPDQEKLRDDDADSIPIPVEEYLVTAMPVLEQEYRIPYPPEAKKSGTQGRVVMDLLIDGEGRVRKADLVGGPGFGLNEAALEAVKNFRFKPARIQDRPVAVKIRYAYNFVLER